MLIDFNKIEKTVLPAFKGGEGEYHARMFTDDNNKIMYGCLPAGSSIGMHTHTRNSEIIYILSGNGKVMYDDTEEALSEGSCHYCPEGHTHSLINNSDSDLKFFAVVPEHKK